MAFPYYNPYQPYYQPSFPQQNAIQPSPQQTAAFNQSGIIWVSGLQEAQMYPLAPNAAVALWEKSGTTIYLKQADATGKPTMTVYDLVERSDAAQDGPGAKKDKPRAYATKDELDAVVEALRADIDSMKGDIYGIAGKKRSRRQEEADDDE